MFFLSDTPTTWSDALVISLLLSTYMGLESSIIIQDQIPTIGSKMCRPMSGEDEPGSTRTIDSFKVTDEGRILF